MQRKQTFITPDYRVHSIGWPCRQLHLGQPGHINRQHFTVQKQQGTERLVVCGHRHPAFIGKHDQKLRDRRATDLTGMPHHPVTPMPAHEKAHPVQVSLLGFEAIVFLTNCVTNLIKQALGLGRIGDRVHSIKTMYENTVSTPESKPSSGVEALFKTSRNLRLQFISSDKLGFQNIRRSTSR